MDLIDPLGDSDKNETEENKILLSNIKTIPMDSDEDDEQQSVEVEVLAPQTLLETQDETGQYSLKSGESPMITYRVLQVHDGPDSPDFVTTSSFSPNNSSIPQVITGSIGSNINGSIYVIGNAETFTTSSPGTRPIAPRPTILDSSMVVQVKKRDEKRRATHNEVERRRRDKINNWIGKLSKILPESPQDVKGNGQYDGHSKGGILSKAFEYIIELQATETRLGSYIKENKKLVNAVEQLRTKNFELESENAQLKELLSDHGIEVKISPASPS